MSYRCCCRAAYGGTHKKCHTIKAAALHFRQTITRWKIILSSDFSSHTIHFRPFPSLPFPCLLYFLSSLCLASFFIRTNHHCTIIVNLYSHFATASVCVCVCSTTFVKYPKDLYFSMNRTYCLSVQFECYELYKRICLTISMFFFSSL